MEAVLFPREARPFYASPEPFMEIMERRLDNMGIHSVSRLGRKNIPGKRVSVLFSFIFSILETYVI